MVPTRPRPGDVLVTNLRRPILRLLEDSSPGVHDTLIPSCDSERYRQLGASGHGSCTDNFRDSLRAIGVEPPRAVPPRRSARVQSTQVALKLRTSYVAMTLSPDP